MGEVQSKPGKVTLYVVCCYTIEFLAVGCGYPKFGWFRALLNKVTGCLIKGHQLWLRFLQSQITGGWESVLGKNITLLVLLWYTFTGICFPVGEGMFSVMNQRVCWVFFFLQSNVVFITAPVPATESVVWSPAICGKGSSRRWWFEAVFSYHDASYTWPVRRKDDRNSIWAWARQCYRGGSDGSCLCCGGERLGWAAVVVSLCQQQNALCAVGSSALQCGEEICFSNYKFALGRVMWDWKVFQTCGIIEVKSWISACKC